MAGWTPLWSPQLQRTPVTLNTLASSGSSFLSFPVAFPSLDGMSMGLMSHPSQLFHQSSSDSAATASTDLPSLLGAASSRSVSGYDVYTLPDVDADMPSAKRSASAPTSSEFAQPPASLLSPPAIGTLPSMPPVDYHPMVIAPHFSSQPSRRVLSECDSPRKTARHVDYDASDMLLLLGQSKDSAVGQANLISTG